MSYLALYRKYRSQSFDELVGQDHIVRTLKAALDERKIAHAYLFTGPRGTGKTSTARILAKALNCEKGPTSSPCNECRLCVAITTGTGGDVIELDAASEAGVDDVRDNIVDRSRYAPMEARYKVYIIDEVHDLSGKAFDALLKTIEEPPPHVIFILATTEYTKVPLTIRSRCQKYEFHRGSIRDLMGRLEYICRSEGIAADKAALLAIARMADGGYRDALTLLEQAIIRADGQITLEGVTAQLGLVDEEEVDKMLLAAVEKDAATLMLCADRAVRMGKDPRSVLESLLYRLSELTYAAYDVDTSEGVDPERKAANHALAVRIGSSRLIAFRTKIADAHKEIRNASLPKLWLEISLLRLIEGEPNDKKSYDRHDTVSSEKQTRAVVTTTTSKTEKRLVTPQLPPPTAFDAESLRPYWQATVEAIKQRFKAAGATLDSVHLKGKIAGEYVCSVSGEFKLKRLQDREELREIIRSTFAKVIGDPAAKIRYELAESARPDDSVGSVESPSEGDALAQLVEDVFQVKPE